MSPVQLYQVFNWNIAVVLREKCPSFLIKKIAIFKRKMSEFLIQ